MSKSFLISLKHLSSVLFLKAYYSKANLKILKIKQQQQKSFCHVPTSWPLAKQSWKNFKSKVLKRFLKDAKMFQLCCQVFAQWSVEESVCRLQSTGYGRTQWDICTSYALCIIMIVTYLFFVWMNFNPTTLWILLERGENYFTQNILKATI